MKPPPSGRAGRAQATPDQGPSSYLPHHRTTVPTLPATRIYTGPSKPARCANCGALGRRHPIRMAVLYAKYPVPQPVYDDSPWVCRRCSGIEVGVV